MKRVLADLKYYNANPSDTHTGDCVKRALSFALKMSYEEVSSELNKIKRRYHYSAWNITPVIQTFLSRRGLVLSKVPKGEQVTVDEFSNTHSGTWILLTGEKDAAFKGFSSHMLCIVDGTVYDSWDSLEHYVVQSVQVTSSATGIVDITYEDVKDELDEFIQDYLQYLQKRCPDSMELEMYGEDNRELYHVNSYTYEVHLLCNFDDVPELSNYSLYNLDYNYVRKILTVKVNPRVSVEQNLQILKKRCKQKIYDWVYAIRKDILDAEEAENVEVNKNYRGGRKALMLLPSWCRSLVRKFYENAAGYEPKYELYIDALEEDPRDIDVVYIEGNTLRELKFNLEKYKNNYERIGYDY